MNIAAFAAHGDPMVRAAVASSIRALLTDSNGLGKRIHPVAVLLAEDILDRLHSCEASDAWTTTISLLSLVENVMDAMPQKTFDELSKFVMKLCGDTAKPEVGFKDFRYLLVIIFS